MMTKDWTTVGWFGMYICDVVLSWHSLHFSMSIFYDFFDGEVFQFHVPVLRRNSAFFGIAGSSVVVAIHGYWFIDQVVKLELHSFLSAHVVHFLDELIPIPASSRAVIQGHRFIVRR